MCEAPQPHRELPCPWPRQTETAASGLGPLGGDIPEALAQRIAEELPLHLVEQRLQVEPIGAEELKRLLLEKVRVFIEELGYDPENLCVLVPRNFETERLLRNLVYVGITRAMDNVNVFTLDSPDPILWDLAACFRA